MKKILYSNNNNIKMSDKQDKKIYLREVSKRKMLEKKVNKNINTYTCDICNKLFSTSYGVYRHQKRSKICQGIKKLPPVSTNPIIEAKKQLNAVFV